MRKPSTATNLSELLDERSLLELTDEGEKEEEEEEEEEEDIDGVEGIMAALPVAGTNTGDEGFEVEDMMRRFCNEIEFAIDKAERNERRES